MATATVWRPPRRRMSPPPTWPVHSKRTCCSGSTRPCSRTVPCCLATKERITCTTSPLPLQVACRWRTPFPRRNLHASRRAIRTTVSMMLMSSTRPRTSPSMSRRSRNRGMFWPSHHWTMFPLKGRRKAAERKTLVEMTTTTVTSMQRRRMRRRMVFLKAMSSCS
uniref:Uncharacterized protein n=1 Tax=Arundo donax TaxID=35708 RepID=A0A0A8Y6B5_ARUDO